MREKSSREKSPREKTSRDYRLGERRVLEKKEFTDWEREGSKRVPEIIK